MHAEQCSAASVAASAMSRLRATAVRSIRAWKPLARPHPGAVGQGVSAAMQQLVPLWTCKSPAKPIGFATPSCPPPSPTLTPAGAQGGGKCARRGGGRGGCRRPRHAGAALRGPAAGGLNWGSTGARRLFAPLRVASRCRYCCVRAMLWQSVCRGLPCHHIQVPAGRQRACRRPGGLDSTSHFSSTLCADCR